MLLITYYLCSGPEEAWSGPHCTPAETIFIIGPDESVDYVAVRSLTRRETRLARAMWQNEGDEPVGNIAKREQARCAFYNALPKIDRLRFGTIIDILET